MSDTTLTLVVAGVGLAGVIVGAFATGGVQWAFERRREKGELRVAARIIYNELASLRALFETIEAARQVLQFRDEDVLAGYQDELARDAARCRATLNTHLPVLAAHLTRDGWQIVAVATSIALRGLEGGDLSADYLQTAKPAVARAVDTLETEFDAVVPKTRSGNARDPSGTPRPLADTEKPR